MISKVYIQALKSIKNLTIMCSKLNLLVGTNSSGKSTFLQALLLEAQNSIDKKGLNGSLVSLGEFREVRNYYMPDESIKIEFWEKGKEESAWIEFIEKKENDNYEVITSINEEIEDDILYGDSLVDENKSSHFSYDLGFHYLSCHRIGVKDIYAKNMLEDGNLGIDGEYALAYLLKHESDPVDEGLRLNNGTIDSLLEQVNYWLEYIVGTKLRINDLKRTNYLQVKYNNNPANENSDALFCRPVNIGSGVSYLISILVVCLGSQKEDIIVIENPEIHLHPKAQSRLCEFLYFVCNADRQLFVESHSDHIFNGIRAGIASQKFDPEDINVNFFALNKNYETQCNPIRFGGFGKIIGENEEMDINDLFDQFEIDLNKMLGL